MVGPGSTATRRSYDRIAARYARQFGDELDSKPFDRQFLDAVDAASTSEGWVIDLGSGPGQIGAYLAARGRRVLNVDLSLEMLREGERAVPAAGRVQADLRSLPFATGSVAAVVAFYSVIHIPPAELGAAMGELARVLARRGVLAVTSHIEPAEGTPGAELVATTTCLHVAQMLSAPVDLDFYFHGSDQLTRHVLEAGLELVACTERAPYSPEVESQTRRTYLMARKGDGGSGPGRAPRSGR